MKYKIITAYIFIFLIALSGCSLLDDKTISEHNNLQSAKIGSLTGSTSETFARQNLTEAAMQSFDNLEIIKSFWGGISGGFYNNIIHENRYQLIIDGLKVTIIISVLSCFFGTLLGALVCFFRISKSSFLKKLASIYISVLRGIPVLVLLMLIFYIVFASVNISPIIVSVIAFALNFAAYVSEMFRTAIEGVDKGQTEAGIATGFTKWQTFIYIVMPQAI